MEAANLPYSLKAIIISTFPLVRRTFTGMTFPYKCIYVNVVPRHSARLPPPLFAVAAVNILLNKFILTTRDITHKKTDCDFGRGKPPKLGSAGARPTCGWRVTDP